MGLHGPSQGQPYFPFMASKVCRNKFKAIISLDRHELQSGLTIYDNFNLFLLAGES
jgi:hypothetical protein